MTRSARRKAARFHQGSKPHASMPCTTIQYGRRWRFASNRPIGPKARWVHTIQVGPPSICFPCCLPTEPQLQSHRESSHRGRNTPRRWCPVHFQPNVTVRIASAAQDASVEMGSLILRRATGNGNGPDDRSQDIRCGAAESQSFPPSAQARPPTEFGISATLRAPLEEQTRTKECTS